MANEENHEPPSSSVKQEWRWRGKMEQQVIDIQKSVDKGAADVVTLATEHRLAVKEIGTQIQILQLTLKTMVTKWVMATGFVGFIATSCVAYIIAKFAK